MTAAARFKESDVTRALKGAKKAGFPVGRAEIDANGTIIIYAAERGMAGKGNPLDRLLP
jgi:hypothetical protein